MKLIISRAFSGVIPFTCTAPPLAGLRPETSFSSVDFPHPEGPRNVTNSPRSTVSEISCKATAAFLKRLVTDCSAISGTVTILALPLLAGTEPKGARSCAEFAVWTAPSSSCRPVAAEYRRKDCDRRAETPSSRLQDECGRREQGQTRSAPT